MSEDVRVLCANSIPPLCATFRKDRSLSLPQPPITSLILPLSSLSLRSIWITFFASDSSLVPFFWCATEGLRERGRPEGVFVLRRDCNVSPKCEGSVARLLRFRVFFDFVRSCCPYESSPLPPASFARLFVDMILLNEHRSIIKADWPGPVGDV